MKHLKFSTFNFRTFLILAAGLGLTTTVVAQPTLNLPATNDNNWYTVANPITGIATAMISYGTNGRIAVSTAFVNGTQRIYAMDPAVGSTSIISSGNVNSLAFDVAIGNWDGVSAHCGTCSAVATDFILACAYRSNTGRVIIDYYDVFDNGTSTISITALGSKKSMSALGPGSFNAGVVHMDLIAEAGNTGPTGRPFCNKFVVTWDDANSHLVFADTSTLNLPHSVLTGTQISTTGVYGTQPDVAAIERDGFGAPNPIHNIGIIAYNGNTAQELDKVEWDYTANTISSPVVMDNFTNPDGVTFPRIDAIDDYNTNQNASNANYKIVAMVKTGSGPAAMDIRTYDDLQLSLTPPYFVNSSYIDISGVSGFSSFTPPYIHVLPTIAFGPENVYQVLHYTDLPSTPTESIVFMEPISLSIPQAFAGNNYYWVNSNGSPLDTVMAVACGDASSTSSPVNEPTAWGLYAWAYQDINGNYKVDYKMTSRANPFVFRQASSVAAPVQNKTWIVYPNPATTELVLKGVIANAGSEYRIMDMVGRLVTKGYITNAVQSIDIGGLAQGNYIISVYKDNVRDGNAMFVKN